MITLIEGTFGIVARYKEQIVIMSGTELKLLLRPDIFSALHKTRNYAEVFYHTYTVFAPANLNLTPANLDILLFTLLRSLAKIIIFIEVWKSENTDIFFLGYSNYAQHFEKSLAFILNADAQARPAIEELQQLLELIKPYLGAYSFTGYKWMHSSSDFVSTLRIMMMSLATTGSIRS